MIPQFRATPAYYPGIQTINVFRDATVRRCIIIFVALFVMCSPFNILQALKPVREAAIMVFVFLVAFPVMMQLHGRIRAATWKWYACMVSLYCLGVIPVMLGASLLFHFFILPALCCAYRMHREAPEIVYFLGYTGGKFQFREAILGLVSATLLIFISYLGVVWVNHTGFRLLPPQEYLMHMLTGSAQYFIMVGILFGILTRYLFEMKFDPLLPILLNMILMMFWWVLAVPFGDKNTGVLVAGVFAGCCLFNAVLGMTYYYIRSTRLVLFIYFLYSFVSISAIT